ncbi:unnamed protein product [Acanthoscelides obtectus]|uniref:Uncharacterized protein n=1 Tax=Acanthoscelides obtectus TaxID=200917 RepID=A0A9P0PVP6_ACAOB|nr:unnamed protein product [Acanthoscelides obtectus]CAK1651417.1 hypothetical protein AOBTE_LOCUS17256 [Acanthoscelides obtectus]
MLKFKHFTKLVPNLRSEGLLKEETLSLSSWLQLFLIYTNF